MMKNNQESEFEYIRHSYDFVPPSGISKIELIEALDHFVDNLDQLPVEVALSSVTRAELATVLRLLSSLFRAP